MLKRLALAAALSASLVLSYAPGAVREEFHQTYPLASGGRVSVRNVNRAVHITAWDRNEVKLDAVKTAESDAALKDARIVVDAHPDSVDIHTRYPEDCRHCASVAYTLTAPRGAALDPVNTVNGAVTVDGVTGPVKVASVNGAVEIHRAEGDVELKTVNGRVEGEFDRLTAKRISLTTVNGGVWLALPRDAGAHLAMGTVHGSIHSDFDLPAEPAHYRVGRRADAQIGSGGHRIEVHTVNGGIKLTRP